MLQISVCLSLSLSVTHGGHPDSLLSGDHRVCAVFFCAVPVPQSSGCNTSPSRHRCRTTLFQAAGDLSGTPCLIVFALSEFPSPTREGPRPKHFGPLGRSALCLPGFDCTGDQCHCHCLAFVRLVVLSTSEPSECEVHCPVPQASRRPLFQCTCWCLRGHVQQGMSGRSLVTTKRGFT